MNKMYTNYKNVYTYSLFKQSNIVCTHPSKHCTYPDNYCNKTKLQMYKNVYKFSKMTAQANERQFPVVLCEGGSKPKEN